MTKHQIINYEINGNVCEFKNNDFNDFTMISGDICTITYNFSFDGKQLINQTDYGKPKEIVKPSKWYDDIRPAYVDKTLFTEKQYGL